MIYSATFIIDASKTMYVEADSLEEAVEKASDLHVYTGLCHECGRDLDVGDVVSMSLSDEEGEEVFNDDHFLQRINELQNQVKALKAEVKRLSSC